MAFLLTLILGFDDRVRAQILVGAAWLVALTVLATTTIPVR